MGGGEGWRREEMVGREKMERREGLGGKDGEGEGMVRYYSI